MSFYSSIKNHFEESLADLHSATDGNEGNKENLLISYSLEKPIRTSKEILFTFNILT